VHLPTAPAPVIKKAAKKAAKKAPAAKASKGKKSPAAKKEKKDPNAPKRGLSAFMFFSKAERAGIIAKNKDISFGEVGKALGAAWAKADDKSKAKFGKMAETDKARYEKEMAKYSK
jgi:hypothetical protein